MLSNINSDADQLLQIILVGQPELRETLGLAWDCGAVTTGPVTVPLVLALGIGVCRIVGGEDTRNAGFGIVTLASLFPILAVLLLSFHHYYADDYHGRPNYPKHLAGASAKAGESASTQSPAFAEAPARCLG